MTDARFSGGSVGLVIGHVGPEAYLGGPIALVEDGDTITIDINICTMDCAELDNKETFEKRREVWDKEKEKYGMHPVVKKIGNRLLKRMRNHARPAIQGAGMEE